MSIIEQFVDQTIEFGSEFKELCSTIIAKYIEFNNGSTNGKMKLYANLKTLTQITKTRTHYIGLRVKQVVPIVVQPVIVKDSKLLELEFLEKLQKEKMLAKEKLLKELKIMEIENQKQIEAEKIKNMTAIEAEKIKNMTAIEAEKIKIEAKKIKIEAETKVKITEMNIKKDMDIINIKIEDNEKHRKWMEHENNKNRLMTSMNRYNQYLDPRIYGTSSQQYIDIDSLISNLQFRTFVATREIKSNVVSDVIKSKHDLIENIEILENNSTKKIDAIRTENIPEIIKDIIDNHSKKDKITHVMNPLSSKLTDFKYETCIGNKRVLSTLFEEQLQTNSKCLKKSMPEKVLLAEKSKFCNLTKKDEKFHVNCFCCNTLIPLLNAMCQRGHNLPKSKGGANIDFNLELICSNCNISMGDMKTIYEYLADTYDISLKKDISL
jgi:5-methylcytosine-specific restriction endonuclease McrA